MCRRFHTDVNELRLLCTYSGPATLWLPEAAADRDAHHTGENNEQIEKPITDNYNGADGAKIARMA